MYETIWPEETVTRVVYPVTDPWWQIVVRGVGGEGDVTLDWGVVDGDLEQLEGAVGSVKVLVPDNSPGLQRIVEDGYCRVGPDSRNIEVLCDGVSMFYGYLKTVSGDPGSGFLTLELADLTGHVDHTVVGTQSLESLLPSFSSWTSANVIVGAGPSVDASEGVSLREMPAGLLEGSGPGNVYRLISTSLARPAGAEPLLMRVWAFFPSTLKRLPVFPLQVLLYNVGSGAAEQLAPSIDPKSTARDVWVRYTAKIPEGDGRQLRIGLWAPQGDDIDAGGTVYYSGAVLVADQGVTVAAGSTTADAAAALFREGFEHANVAASAYAASATEQSYDEPQTWMSVEKPDVFGAIQGLHANTWIWRPGERLVMCGAPGGMGSLQAGLTFGTDGRDGDVSKWEHSSDGMETRVYDLGPDSDEAREMGVAERAALHPWEDAQTVPAGTMPSSLGSFALGRVYGAGLEKRVTYEVELGTPPGGRCPTDWFMPQFGGLALGDQVPTRVVAGPLIDMADTVRITGVKFTPATGAAKVTVE